MKLNTLALAALIVFLAASNASAQNFIGVEYKVSSGEKASATLNTWLEKKAKSRNYNLLVADMKEHQRVLTDAENASPAVYAAPGVVSKEETVTGLKETIRKLQERADRIPRWGLFVWGQGQGQRGSPSWGQTYGGLIYYPRPWIEFAAGVGVEKDANPGRIAAAMFASGHLGNALLIVEDGGSGFWYKAVFTHHIAGRISGGIFSKRFAGTGPIVEVKASNRYTVWVTAGPDFQDQNRLKAVVGLNIGLP